MNVLTEEAMCRLTFECTNTGSGGRALYYLKAEDPPPGFGRIEYPNECEIRAAFRIHFPNDDQLPRVVSRGTLGITIEMPVGISEERQQVFADAIARHM